MTDLFGFESGAVFSPCRTWRYKLWRIWNRDLPLLAMGMLNPSKAGEDENDPTVARQIERAHRGGYGGLIVFNAHAYVETYPKEMKRQLAAGVDIVGPQNDAHTLSILQEVRHGRGLVCVWAGEWMAA